jgi:hypothetical protein
VKVRVMMDGGCGDREYEAHEVNGIIDTPEEYLLVLKEPRHGEILVKVQKKYFYLMIDERLGG